MARFRRLLTALFLLLSCTSVLAADYTIREWSNDIKTFQNQVLEPSAEHFRTEGCADNTDKYLVALFSRLTEIKTTVHAKSYLLLRDSILATAADLTSWDEQISCSVIDKWALIESHMYNELELIGNVLLITE